MYRPPPGPAADSAYLMRHPLSLGNLAKHFRQVTFFFPFPSPPYAQNFLFRPP